MNKKSRESNIARTRSSVEKKEWRKDEKTAKKIDTYNLIIKEKVTSWLMKSVLSQTGWVKLKEMHVKPEVRKSEHFIEMNIIL